MVGILQLLLKKKKGGKKESVRSRSNLTVCLSVVIKKEENEADSEVGKIPAVMCESDEKCPKL